MYYVSAQSVDERMISVDYYYCSEQKKEEEKRIVTFNVPFWW